MRSSKYKSTLQATSSSLHQSQYQYRLSAAPVQSNSERCILPLGGFKSWSRGVVTPLTPNCTLLFEGSECEVERVQNGSHILSRKDNVSMNFMKWTEDNCTQYKQKLENNVYTTKEEVTFPLAFALIVHDSPSQVFRLLKVLYRPHNIYCIHYDNKSSQDTKHLFNNLAVCIDNIITPTNFIEVHWGHRSLMEAQMNCFKNLLKKHNSYPWRYVITLCGKELPLRTNREIVYLLKSLNGTSAVHALSTPDWEQKRFTHKWTQDEMQPSKYYPTQELAGPIPFNLTIYKSMVYFALSPEFVEYVLYDPVAVALIRFLKDAYIPEEHFYSTLFMIPGKIGCNGIPLSVTVYMHACTVTVM